MENLLLFLLIIFWPVQLSWHLFALGTAVSGIQVDYLIPTIYPSDFIIIALIVYFLWKRKKSWRLATQILHHKKVVLFLVSMVIFGFINVSTALDKSAAIYAWVKVIEFVVLGLCILKIKPKVYSLIPPLVIALTISSCIALHQFLLQHSLGGALWFLGERAFSSGTPGIALSSIMGTLILRPYATFPHPNVLAGFLVLGLSFIGSYIAYKKPSAVRKKVLLVTYCLSFITLITTLSLSASLAYLGGTILLTLTVWQKTKQKDLKSIVPLFVLLASFLLVVITLIAKTTAGEFSDNATLRVELAKDAVTLVQSHPLFGVGLNNFIPNLTTFPITRERIFWWQPVHNIFLLVASETGMIGLIAFLGLLFITVKKAVSLWHAGIVLPLILLLQTLSVGFFDHYFLTLQQGEIAFFLVLILAFLPKTSYT